MVTGAPRQTRQAHPLPTAYREQNSVSKHVSKHSAPRSARRDPSSAPAALPGGSAKHRQAPGRTLGTSSRRVVRSTVILSSLAVAATGAAVATGMATGSDLAPSQDVATASGPLGAAPAAGVSADDAAATEAALQDRLARRATTVSRSARRTVADPVKKAALGAVTTDDLPAVTHTENIADDDPRTIGRALLAEFGFGDDQFSCLDSLFTRESGWNIHADNPSSSAYGIPQALPGSKMSSAGPDWADDPVTQIRWGLGYIQDRYGSPCGAWGHSQSYGWY